jgi:DNA-binding FrmR family transcriptional regulator
LPRLPGKGYEKENLDVRLSRKLTQQRQFIRQQQLWFPRRFQLSGLTHLEEQEMKIQNPEAKEKLTQRLRRIEGQVHGVLNMLDEKRYCRDIMQQLSAIHSAVQGASRVFLQEYATVCLVEMDEEGQTESSSNLRTNREKVIQDMIALLDKAP